MARVTIKEIAKKAGVSIGTVDRVINNRGKVRPETENRIRQICNELGYESNFLAKALVLGKKESNIAVIITNPERNGFTRNVKNGFDAAAEKLRDYNVHFNFYFLEKNVEDKIIEYLAELRLNPPSGIIIKPCDSEKVRTVLSEFTDMGIPIITCTSDLDGVDALCFVGQNHYQDGRIAANMLCLQFKEEASLAVITNPPRVSPETTNGWFFLVFEGDK